MKHPTAKRTPQGKARTLAMKQARQNKRLGIVR